MNDPRKPRLDDVYGRPRSIESAPASGREVPDRWPGHSTEEPIPLRARDGGGTERGQQQTKGEREEPLPLPGWLLKLYFVFPVILYIPDAIFNYVRPVRSQLA